MDDNELDNLSLSSETTRIGDAEISALRERILDNGLCAQDFRTLLDGNPGAFQRIFGECVLLKIEFDVALFGEHSHLVFVPHHGEQPEIITGFPKHGKLRVNGPIEWHGSVHSPLRRKGSRQRVGVIADPFSHQDWLRVSILARAIDEARLNYNFVTQNSNSVVATLADAANTGFVDLPGGGLNLGSSNLLYDELMGGWQWPRFLIRGGTSHSGAVASPAPRSLPDEARSNG